MLWVVSYDVTDDERRLRVSRTLEGFGARVQYSVFECHLSDRELGELQARLAVLVEPKEDGVRYYRICKDCVAQVRLVGGAPLTEETGYYVV